ncbi:hypothetical protein FB451DRAFT_1375246 [Mycena latifolia]|nr:hypothetical protein FB451DRAFT_1375246 [Mycena latifolia]
MQIQTQFDRSVYRQTCFLVDRTVTGLRRDRYRDGAGIRSGVKPRRCAEKGRRKRAVCGVQWRRRMGLEDDARQRGSPSRRVLCAAAASLGVVDGGAEELTGAVLNAPPLLPDTRGAEEADADAEIDDGMNEEKERDGGWEAAAQDCSTSASAEGTSSGHAVRHGMREAAVGLKGIEKKGERESGDAQRATQKQFTATPIRGRGGEAQAVRHRARQLAYKHEEVAHAPHDDTPLREGSAAELVGALLEHKTAVVGERKARLMGSVIWHLFTKAVCNAMQRIAPPVLAGS